MLDFKFNKVGLSRHLGLPCWTVEVWTGGTQGRALGYWGEEEWRGGRGDRGSRWVRAGASCGSGGYQEKLAELLDTFHRHGTWDTACGGRLWVGLIPSPELLFNPQ